MTSKKVIEIFNENENKKLVLPNFQRGLEWKVDRQKQLVSSFMLKLPIGSLLLLEGKRKDFASKRMCFPKEIINPKPECTYLLDGQQRVSSLRNIFSDFFSDQANWTNALNDIYPDLRYRWFVNVIPKTGEEDIFGWEKLSFGDVDLYEPKQLIEMFDVKRIYVSKTDQWFNPGYIAKDQHGIVLKGYSRNNHIAVKAADSGLVPLYTIYNKANPSLHELALRHIAAKRVVGLMARAGNNRQRIKNYLYAVDPDIINKIATKNKKGIETAWNLLSVEWVRAVSYYLDSLLNQEISVIVVPANQTSRAISIYESINLGGTPLSTFDLIVARAARNSTLSSLTERISDELNKSIIIPTSLTHYLSGQTSNLSNWKPEYMGALSDNKISRTIKDQYLNLLSIFSHTNYGNVDEIAVSHTKRSKQLELSESKINNNNMVTIKSIIRACVFTHIRCGIVKIDDLPYELMLLPIAYALKEDRFWNDLRSVNKIENWYWSSLFSGAYREAQNEQCKNDIKQLYNWLNGTITAVSYKNKLFDNYGYSDRNTLLKKSSDDDVPKAIEKAILQYIISCQPIDFLPNSNHNYYLNSWDIAQAKSYIYNNVPYSLKVEKHHIWPLSNATTIGQSSKEIRNNKQHILNSPLNLTFISDKANSLLSNLNPSQYFDQIDRLSLIKHFIPHPISNHLEKPGEQKDQYYLRVLEERFNIIERNLIDELSNLK